MLQVALRYVITARHNFTQNQYVCNVVQVQKKEFIASIVGLFLVKNRCVLLGINYNMNVLADGQRFVIFVDCELNSMGTMFTMIGGATMTFARNVMKKSQKNIA